jgi:hypothetical protein
MPPGAEQRGAVMCVLTRRPRVILARCSVLRSRARIGRYGRARPRRARMSDGARIAGSALSTPGAHSLFCAALGRAPRAGNRCGARRRLRGVRERALVASGHRIVAVVLAPRGPPIQTSTVDPGLLGRGWRDDHASFVGGEGRGCDGGRARAGAGICRASR